MYEEIDKIRNRFEKDDNFGLVLDLAEYLSPDQFSQMFDITYETEDDKLKKQIINESREFLKGYFSKVQLAKKLIK